MDIIKKPNGQIVAKNVRKLIIESDYTNEKLAGILNISPRLVYFWCNGERIPNTSNLYALSQLFKVSMESILN